MPDMQKLILSAMSYKSNIALDFFVVVRSCFRILIKGKVGVTSYVVLHYVTDWVLSGVLSSCVPLYFDFPASKLNPWVSLQ